MTESSSDHGKDLNSVSATKPVSKSPGGYYHFTIGDEVLSRWSDGLLYLGVILDVDYCSEKCLLKFEDSSEYWIKFKDICKGAPPDSDIICSVCNCGTSETPNEIVLCDYCGVGYHQNCHIPPIPNSILLPDVEWHCRQCVFASAAKKGGAENTGLFAQVMQTMKQALPYNLKELTWDSQHKTNAQQLYCYCGGPGDWFHNMLQCNQCKQWFHEACIQCLSKPLLYGDRFYVFICSVCNSGPEYVKRIELKWVDVVHLALFNLTIQHNKTYFDIRADILKFINSRWSLLQLQGELSKCRPSQREEIVITILQNNHTRFKCGREIKKKTSLWGLRSRVVPPVPKTVFNSESPFVESLSSEIKQKLKLHSSLSSDCKPKKRKRKGSENHTTSFESQNYQHSLLTPPAKEPTQSALGLKKIRHSLKLPVDPTKVRRNIGLQLPPQFNNKSKPRRVLCRQQNQPQPQASARKGCSIPPIRRSRKLKSSRGADSRKAHRNVCDDFDYENIPNCSLDSLIPLPSDFKGPNNPFYDFNTVFFYRHCNNTDVHLTSRQKRSKRQHKLRDESTKASVWMITNPPGPSSGHCGQLQCSERICEANGHVGGTEINDRSGSLRKYANRTASKAGSLNGDLVPLSRLESRHTQNGKKMKVLGSRVTLAGKLQYLIEWIDAKQ